MSVQHMLYIKKRMLNGIGETSFAINIETLVCVFQARTQEAEPIGSVGLNAEVLSPRTVRALWTAPSVPNGYLYYDVYFEGIFYVDPGTF